MNKNEIQRLIDRYLNGVTTPEEEQQLARALLGGNIPDEWKVLQHLVLKCHRTQNAFLGLLKKLTLNSTASCVTSMTTKIFK